MTEDNTIEGQRYLIKYIKDNISNALYFVVVTAFIWVAISNIIQAFKCPKMSQTELFIHIPKSFVCDWQQCK